MKSDLTGMSTQNSKKDMKETTKESKENLANDQLSENSHRSFGVVDLWNVRKKQRTSASLSRWLN